ncbi:type II/IV secretion system protein [candidate division KSB1 bacterium]|nr:type II/IV secretion system protein [candidate division KSB1 bacterium]
MAERRSITAEINLKSPGRSYGRLSETLIDRGIITEDMIHRAADIQSREPRNAKRKLIDILIQDLNVDRNAVYMEMARLYKFQIIDLSPDTIDRNRIEFIKEIVYGIPEDVSNEMLSMKVMPFKWHEYKRNVLILVTGDPTNQKVHDFAKKVDVADIDIAYAPEEMIEALIHEIFYSNNEFLQKIFDEAQEIEVFEDDSRQLDEDALDAEINKSRLVNLIEGMLVEAVRKGASDIHIIPKAGNLTDIFLRVDGKLQPWYTQSEIKPEAVVAVIKDRSINIDRFDRSVAQDGYIQRKIDGYYIRFRVSVIPIVGEEFDRRFESVVVRVLDDRKLITDLEELGLQQQALNDFKKAIEQPQGMIILTGPTGSGKSTTLVAALNHVMDPSKNVLTVEEPVEYLIGGARQVKLNPKLNFDSALRSILRHDPDIVMVGEIRDLKSAEIAISLANTGHLTFSTLHTNDAPSAISRLYMLGVEPFLIANAINLAMAQRLVRKLCDECKRVNENPDPDKLLRLGFTKEETAQTSFYEAVGCKNCFEGYKGRVAISEALLFNKEIREQILTAKDDIDDEALRTIAMEKGMLSLRQSGKERIRSGLTTMGEIIAATVEQ